MERIQSTFFFFLFFFRLFLILLINTADFLSLICVSGVCYNISMSRRDRDWAMLSASEKQREKELRPSNMQRAAYFVIGFLTVLATIRKLGLNCLCSFFFSLSFFFLFCTRSNSKSGSASRVVEQRQSHSMC
jgi:hypothetical protein